MFSVEPSEVPEDGGPSIDESGRPAPPAMPPWRLYGYAVASFGLYLPFWAYRLARAHGCRKWSVKAAWALGSLVPPVAAALLYEFNGPPRDDTPSDEAPSDEAPSDEAPSDEAPSDDPLTPAARDSPRRAPPALLLLLLLAVCSFSPLSGFYLAPLFLLPIAFAWVQSTINRLTRASGLPGKTAVAPMRWWNWAAASIGGLLLVVALWYETPGFLRQLRKIEADAVVASDSDRFELTVPSQHWRRVEAGTIGDDDSELELTGPGAETWAVAYLRPRSETDLDNVIADRKSMLFASGKPLDYRETRRFLAGSDFLPVSTADYELDFGLGTEGFYVVLTAETEDQVIELITYTAEPAAHLDEVRRLVQSFALKPPKDESGEEES